MPAWIWRETSPGPACEHREGERQKKEIDDIYESMRGYIYIIIYIYACVRVCVCVIDILSNITVYNI